MKAYKSKENNSVHFVLAILTWLGCLQKENIHGPVCACSLATKVKTSEDLTENRLSNSLLQAGLNDSTSNAINIFDANVATALAPAIVDVSRNDTSELNSFDFKMTNPEVFNLPAGPVGMLVGFEIRKENSFRILIKW